LNPSRKSSSCKPVCAVFIALHLMQNVNQLNKRLHFVAKHNINVASSVQAYFQTRA